MLHGAYTAQEALKAGVLDAIEIQLRPVLLGQGRRLFDGLPAEHVELDLVRVLEAPGTLHLRYDVEKAAKRSSDRRMEKGRHGPADRLGTHDAGRRHGPAGEVVPTRRVTSRSTGSRSWGRRRVPARPRDLPGAQGSGRPRPDATRTCSTRCRSTSPRGPCRVHWSGTRSCSARIPWRPCPRRRRRTRVGDLVRLRGARDLPRAPRTRRRGPCLAAPDGVGTRASGPSTPASCRCGSGSITASPYDSGVVKLSYAPVAE